ncbi:uncharacterized protein LOC102680415 [Apis dorsata]|uniref:uncharacterized protein LOC102680415 n=1 Tax=Apis dorsata TaxID=7462 RepID=UPI0012930611|nr:uncharacterized protein LOC102680415 [Apis dorsata]
MKVIEKTRKITDNFNRELLFFYHQKHKMCFKLFLLMSIIVTNVSWANDQQFYKENQQLLLNGEIKPILKKNNEQLLQRNKDIKTTINKYIKIKKEENIDPWKFLEHRDRIQFQIEGYDGPQTYIFGFDTGYGNNRQYRLEEKYRNGTIKGQYGYYDAKGKLKKIRYLATPFKGYTEIHHESNIQKRKN